MNEKPTLALRIKQLEKGESFIVKTAAERFKAWSHIRTLREAEVLQHTIKVAVVRGGFMIYAIPLSKPHASKPRQKKKTAAKSIATVSTKANHARHHRTVPDPA